jgi:hypothetical protein
LERESALAFSNLLANSQQQTQKENDELKDLLKAEKERWVESIIGDTADRGNHSRHACMNAEWNF